MSKIEAQKTLAIALMEDLYPVDPFVMVAGGAPRDWDLGFEANDLDIYLRAPNHNTDSLRQKLLEFVGIRGIQKLGQNYGNGSNTAFIEGLEYVFEGTYSGQKVQIMFMSKGVHEEITRQFDVDINDIYMDVCGKVHVSEAYEIAMSTQVSYLREKYYGEEKHVLKMKERFPTISFIKPTKEQQFQRAKEIYELRQRKAVGGFENFFSEQI